MPINIFRRIGAGAQRAACSEGQAESVIHGVTGQNDGTWNGKFIN